tara:strand:- start:243 stop:590 length:348 start_codon:yes stop_codon:yes gene_type:complete
MAKVNEKTNVVIVNCNISFMEIMTQEFSLFSGEYIMGEYLLDEYDPLIQAFIDEAVKRWNNGLRGYYKTDEFYKFVGSVHTLKWDSYKKIKKYYSDSYKKFKKYCKEQLGFELEL